MNASKMKKTNLLNRPARLVQNLMITICIALILNACKKEDDDYVPYVHELTFTFNGQNHKLTSQWTTMDLFDITSFRFIYNGGFNIHRTDLFGGSIHVMYNRQTRGVECAWLQPENYPLITALDCNNLNVAGMPIDSVKVFWLHSVNYSEGLSNCKSTQSAQHKQCQLDANFSLTLVNKNNEKIILTNGKVRARIELQM